MPSNTFFIDGKKVEQQDRFGDGSLWFEMMLLPDQAEVTGPFTPVEFARHRAWGLDPAWAERQAIHVPMQDTNDTYNGGFWPQKQCEPADVIAAGLRFGRQYRHAFSIIGINKKPEFQPWLDALRIRRW